VTARAAMLVLLLSALCGCAKPLGTVTERWVVLARTYTPETSGTGFSSKGSLVFTSTDASWAIVFDTPHGMQTVDNNRKWWHAATIGAAFIVTSEHYDDGSYYPSTYYREAAK